MSNLIKAIVCLAINWAIVALIQLGNISGAMGWIFIGVQFTAVLFQTYFIVAMFRESVADKS